MRLRVSNVRYHPSKDFDLRPHQAQLRALVLLVELSAHFCREFAARDYALSHRRLLCM